MRKLVFLVSSAVDCDENAQIVGAWRYADAGPGELCAQLVKAPRCYSLDGAIDVECRDRRMVGGLFGDVRDSYWSLGGVGGGCSYDFLRIAKDRRRAILDFPVALKSFSNRSI